MSITALTHAEAPQRSDHAASTRTARENSLNLSIFNVDVDDDTFDVTLAVNSAVSDSTLLPTSAIDRISSITLCTKALKSKKKKKKKKKKNFVLVPIAVQIFFFFFFFFFFFSFLCRYEGTMAMP
jgi:ABC-type Na+ efflux pump permease subunit